MTAYDYEIGDVVALTAEFTDAAGAYVDPTTVTFYVRPPGGAEISKAYPADGEVVRTGQGRFRFLHEPALGGTFKYRSKGAGAVKAAAIGSFTVAPQEFSG